MLPRLIRCHHPPSAVVQLLFCLSFHSSRHQPGAFPQCCCKSYHLFYLLTQLSRAKGWRRKGWWGSWLQWSLSPYRLHLQEEPLLSFWCLLPSCSLQHNTPHPHRCALGSARCPLPSSQICCSSSPRLFHWDTSLRSSEKTALSMWAQKHACAHPYRQIFGLDLE